MREGRVPRQDARHLEADIVCGAEGAFVQDVVVGHKDGVARTERAMVDLGGGQQVRQAVRAQVP
eukprot:7754559-Alexandrium_andersonii.AAC.1